MSFLYRPTPVVRLGSGPFASTRVINGWTGAVMRGIPLGSSPLGAGAPTGAVSRMRRVDTRMQPWIKSSGTMGSFIPFGLGQDDGSGIDFSSIDVSPILPDASAAPVDLTPPDIGAGLPSFNPNTPALVPVSSGPLAPLDLQPSTYSAPTALTPPAAGAGPTGTGIPGTQPLNLLPAAVQAGTGLLNTIKSWFAPSTPPAYKALPGYGGGAAATAPVAQAGILPGVSNTVLLFGVGAIVVIAAMSGGKK